MITPTKKKARKSARGVSHQNKIAVSISFDNDLASRIKSHAAATGRSVAGLIRFAALSYLDGIAEKEQEATK